MLPKRIWVLGDNGWYSFSSAKTSYEVLLEARRKIIRDWLAERESKNLHWRDAVAKMKDLDLWEDPTEFEREDYYWRRYGCG